MHYACGNLRTPVRKGVIPCAPLKKPLDFSQTETSAADSKSEGYAEKVKLAEHLHAQGVNPSRWTEAHPARQSDQQHFQETGRKARDNQFDVGGKLYDWSPAVTATPEQAKAIADAYVATPHDPARARAAPPVEEIVDVNQVPRTHPFGTPHLKRPANDMSAAEERTALFRHYAQSGVDPDKAHLGDPLVMADQERLKAEIEKVLPGDKTEISGLPIFYQGFDDGWIYQTNAHTRESEEVERIRREHAERPLNRHLPAITAVNDNGQSLEDRIARHYQERVGIDHNRHIANSSDILVNASDIDNIRLMQSNPEHEVQPSLQQDEQKRFYREQERLQAIQSENDRSEQRNAARSRTEDRAERLSKSEPIPAVDGDSRKQCILNNGGRRFPIDDNSDANGDAPYYEDEEYSQVGRFSDLIEEVAKEQDVDPDLIKAIMYMETTHGYYEKLVSWFDGNDSILPMNVNVTYWGDVFGTREELQGPRANIVAGAKMLRAIQNNLPDGAPVSHIASLYNSHRAVKVNNYGARVSRIYAEKPWNQQRGVQQ